MVPILEILLKKNYTADLYSFSNEPDHFQPKQDTNEKNLLRASSRFPKQFDPSFPDFLLPPHRSKQALLRKHFESYDFLIGSGQAPAVMECIQRRLDIFIPYGSDLYQLAVPPPLPSFLKLVAPAIRSSVLFFKNTFVVFEKHLNAYMHYNLSWHQKKGIQKSKRIFLAGVPKEFIPEKLLPTLNHKGLPVAIPMVGNYHFYKNPKIQSSASKSQKQFLKLRKKYKFLIFHHTRHFWKTTGDRWSNKRNDILFRGLQKFLQQHPGQRKKCGLICFEYGPDVRASKELCGQLGISGNVHWMKVMGRKELMGGIALADLGVVEFGTTWLTGGVLFEFLASGIPVIQRLVKEEIIHKGMAAMPVIPANSAIQVCRALSAFFRQRAKLLRLGEKGKEWYENEVREKFSNALFKDLSVAHLS